MRERSQEAASARSTLLGLAAVFLVVAAGLDTRIATALAPYPEGLLTPMLPEHLSALRLEVAAGALVLIVGGIGIGSRPSLDHRLGRYRVPLAGLLIVLLAEVVLRVYVPDRARIFEPDAKLGWKLAAGATGVWGGSRVEVNGHGLRGPDRPYEKPAGLRRVLALGDSVTFGFSLDYEDTFVARLEQLLRARGEAVEVINGGVGGYSPWQVHEFLATEGLRYRPDLAIVFLVLNDVDEKFALERFGGEFPSIQLMMRDPPSWMRSGIVFNLWFRWYFEKQAARQKPPEPRILQDLHTADVLWHPNSPMVEEGWRITLENLGAVVDLCREQQLKLLLVVFPFVVQFDVPGLDVPQRRFADFAADNEVPLLDLLPLLRAKAEVLEVEPAAFFLDMSHVSPLGAGVVAEALVEFIDAAGGIP